MLIVFKNAFLCHKSKFPKNLDGKKRPQNCSIDSACCIGLKKHPYFYFCNYKASNIDQSSKKTSYRHGMDDNPNKNTIHIVPYKCVCRNIFWPTLHCALNWRRKLDYSRKGGQLTKNYVLAQRVISILNEIFSTAYRNWHYFQWNLCRVKEGFRNCYSKS